MDNKLLAAAIRRCEARLRVMRHFLGETEDIDRSAAAVRACIGVLADDMWTDMTESSRMEDLDDREVALDKALGRTWDDVDGENIAGNGVSGGNVAADSLEDGNSQLVMAKEA